MRMIIFIIKNEMYYNRITKYNHKFSVSYRIIIKLKIYFMKYLTHIIIFPKKLYFLNLRKISYFLFFIIEFQLIVLVMV